MIIRVPRIQMVWDSIPMQLAKESRKFIYGMLREGPEQKSLNWHCNGCLTAVWFIKTGESKSPVFQYTGSGEGYSTACVRWEITIIFNML